MANRITKTIEQTDLIYGILTNEGGVAQDGGIISVIGHVEGKKALEVLKKKVGADAILIDYSHRVTKYSMNVETFIDNAENAEIVEE